MSTDIIAPEPMIIDAPPAEEAKVPEEHIERAEEAEEEAEEHTVALRLKEVWRTDRLFTVINDQTTDNSTIRGVINALREHKSVDGCITVERGYTESGSPGGRLYAEAGSLQNMPGYLRRFLAHGVYADIDIKNAFPTFLLQLCERARLKTPCLRRYVSDRDGVFAELRAHLDAKPDAAELFAHVDKCGLKRGMISILHGGDYRNAIFCHPDDTALPKGKWRRTLNPTTLPFCDAFTAEVKGIAAALARLPDHTGDWALAHKKAAKKQGHDGTGCRAHGNAHGIFVSLICQRVERRVTDCMRKAFEARGRTVSVLVFDGQMVLLQAGEAAIAPALLRGIEATVEEQAGFRIELVEKSLAPTAEDAARLQRAMQTVDQRVEAMKKAHPGVEWVVKPGFQPTKEDLFDPAVLVSLLVSNMGSGKTYALKDGLGDILSEDGAPESTRILLITCRVQQALSALAELGHVSGAHRFQSYHDCKASDQHQLVIQYESLHTLQVRGQPFEGYDLVILDEARGTLAQAGQIKTNKNRLRTNADVFRTIMRTAKRVVGMDADLLYDDLVFRTLKEVLPANTPVRCTVYTETRPAMQRQIGLLGKEEWYHALKQTLSEGKRAMACFRTKADLLTICSQLAKELPALAANPAAVLTIHSDTDPAELKRVFGDVNAATARCSLLAFTSKMTVGTDIQTPFDQVFLYAPSGGQQGATARDMFQMLGRARNVRDTVVRACLPPAKASCVLTPEHILQNLEASKKKRQSYIDEVTHQVAITNRAGMVQWSPSFVGFSYAYAESERQRNFATEFVRLAQQKRWTIVALPGQDLTDEQTAKIAANTHDAHSEVTKQARDAKEAAFDDLVAAARANADTDAGRAAFYLARHQELQRLSHRLTAAQAHQLRLLNALREPFGDTLSFMSYEDASALVPQVPAMRALHTRAAMLADGEDPALADVGALTRMAMPETQRLPQLQLKAYLDAMQALGVEPDATAATVPATTVVRSRKRLRAAFDEFDVASANHAAVAKRAAPAVKGAAALISDRKRLAAMLSYYGRTLRSERRQAKGVRDTRLVIAADERFDTYAGVAEFDTHADRGRVHELMQVNEDAV